jgi:hypothetical protein
MSRVTARKSDLTPQYGKIDGFGQERLGTAYVTEATVKVHVMS